MKKGKTPVSRTGVNEFARSLNCLKTVSILTGLFCPVRHPATGVTGKKEVRPSGPASSYHLPAALSIRASDGLRTFYAGVFDPDSRTFFKRLKPNHILRFPPAIALQTSVVEELQRLGCERIEVQMPDGDVLSVPFALFTRRARTLNRGFGAQLALPIALWHNRRMEAAQLSLFAGGENDRVG
jgi:hypothetical protein